MQTTLKEYSLDTQQSPMHNIVKEFEDFAYIVSHDLNTPLRHLKQFVGLLVGNQPSMMEPEKKEYVHYIQKSLERLDDMQTALLSFSRVNTRAQSPTRISADELVQGALNALSQQIADYNPVISYKNLPVITADPSQMHMVFYHLISNAIKFHKNGGQRKISITAESNNDMVIFEIRDNGIGIAPGYHEDIFKMFRRLHTAEEYPGIGAGLTLARKIVERHGGRIWIGSEPQKGLSVFFALPK